MLANTSLILTTENVFQAISPGVETLGSLILYRVLQGLSQLKVHCERPLSHYTHVYTHAHTHMHTHLFTCTHTFACTQWEAGERREEEEERREGERREGERREGGG